MTTTTVWKSGWDADNPMDIKTGLTRRDQGGWLSGPMSGAAYRDLGLAAHCDGLLSAHHVKYDADTSASTDWQFHDADFHWFFVLSGEITIDNENGEKVTLGRGGSAYQPPYWRHRIVSATSDFEAYEVFGPAEYTTTTGKEALKPTEAEQFSRLSAVYTDDAPESYVRGDGPRAWSLYRDLGTRTPTDGRVHIHIIALDEEKPSPAGGTGAHAHTMAQWFLPIRGWIDIAAEGQPNHRLSAGDFMMLQRGATHDAFDASPDYATLEFCVPADYDTDPR